MISEDDNELEGIVCECGETFESTIAFGKHYEEEHFEKELEEPKEEVQEPRNDDFIAYKCSVCEELFMTKKLCNSHIRKEHLIEPNKNKNDRQIICEVCGKKYSSNAALRYHFRVHTGEKPYHCSLCPKQFTMPLFLQIHMRTHTGEKPYVCSLCAKAFTNKAALLRHDRVHTGIKPYPCPKCGKTFTQSNSMKLHVKTVHYKMPSPYKSKARKLKQAMKAQAGKKTVTISENFKIIKVEKQDEYADESLKEEITDDNHVYDSANWSLDQGEKRESLMQRVEDDLVKLEVVNDEDHFDDDQLNDGDNKVYELVEIGDVLKMNNVINNNRGEVTVIYSDGTYQVVSHKPAD